MIGVGSSFQSPVCSTVPSGVRMISAFDSGIECDIETSSTSNGPRWKRLPSGITFMGTSEAPRLAQALRLEQRGGERRRVDRAAQPRPQVDQRAEMILVRVREHQPGEIAPLLHQEGDVRHDQIDAGQIVARERDTEIDRHPGALAALADPIEREIHPDLADPAERREQELGAARHHDVPCGNATSPCGRATCVLWAPEHLTDRDGFELAGGQAQHQPPHAVEGFEPARQLAIGKPHHDVAADAGGVLQPFGADRREARAAIPLRETRDHGARQCLEQILAASPPRRAPRDWSPDRPVRAG